MKLEYLQFRPIKNIGSLIGFCSFKIGREYSWYQLGVHKLDRPKGDIKIRLLYPEQQTPSTRIMQEEIDKEINSYLISQYPESIK